MEKDVQIVEELQDSRNSPITKLMTKVRWYHILLLALILGVLFYWQYSSISKAKFIQNEKDTIFNSLTYFNATNQTKIMSKVNSAGYFDPAPTLSIILFFVIIIVYILSRKKFIPLDWHKVLSIVRVSVHREIGNGLAFPNGTRFQIGPECKEVRTGTVGLQALLPTKVVTKLICFYPNGLIAGFLAFVDTNDCHFMGLMKVGIDEINEQYRDIKVVKPKELWLAEMSRGSGSVGHNAYQPYNPYQDFV